MRSSLLIVVALATGCGARSPGAAAPPRCALPEPEVLHRHDTIVAERWILDDADRWLSSAEAAGPATERFRAAIRARVDVEPRAIYDRQIARYAGSSDPMERGELANATLVRDGKVGRLRSMSCLEVALYERQTAQYPQERHPREFHGFILRKGDRLDVVRLASDEPFPPKPRPAMAHVEAAIARGWSWWGHLHNHTFELTTDRHAPLGTPAPSTTDVQFYRNNAELGLARALVTNGFVTIELAASELAQLSAR